MITPQYFRTQTWNNIETFTKEAPSQKMTIDDDISWVMWQVNILQTRKKNVLEFWVIMEEIRTS